MCSLRSLSITNGRHISREISIEHPSVGLASLAQSGHKIGQNGEDFHAGTTSVPLQWQIFACYNNLYQINWWAPPVVLVCPIHCKGINCLSAHIPEPAVEPLSLPIATIGKSIHCVRAPYGIHPCKHVRVNTLVIIVHDFAQAIC